MMIMVRWITPMHFRGEEDEEDEEEADRLDCRSIVMECRAFKSFNFEFTQRERNRITHSSGSYDIDNYAEWY